MKPPNCPKAVRWLIWAASAWAFGAILAIGSSEGWTTGLEVCGLLVFICGVLYMASKTDQASAPITHVNSWITWLSAAGIGAVLDLLCLIN
jgi:hypothetical protein